jgi:hypothetical protein
MNAGRSAGNCEHSLILSLDDGAGANTWRDDPNVIGCELQTHDAQPIVIEARRWHAPNAHLLLGELVLAVHVPIW